MDETVIVIMTKDKQTGFLDKEFASFRLPLYEELIVNIFGEIMGEDVFITMKVTTNIDVYDWQYNAIFDYYDDGIFFGVVTSIREDAEQYNPTWEVIFKAIDDGVLLQEKIFKILELHMNELNSVYEAIKGLEEEYS